MEKMVIFGVLYTYEENNRTDRESRIKNKVSCCQNSIYILVSHLLSE
jgi:hypothetical protein